MNRHLISNFFVFLLFFQSFVFLAKHPIVILYCYFFIRNIQFVSQQNPIIIIGFLRCIHYKTDCRFGYIHHNHAIQTKLLIGKRRVLMTQIFDDSMCSGIQYILKDQQYLVRASTLGTPRLYFW